MLTGIKELFQHMHWADALVWASVFKLADPDDHPRLMELFYHIHTVQHVYLCLWQDQLINVPEITDFKEIADISRWADEFYKSLWKYLDGIDESALEEIVNLPWADRLQDRLGKQPSPATLSQTMQQVVSHSTYHRGQVNKLLRELNGEPPLVDFISWIWLGKPQVTWPEV